MLSAIHRVGPWPKSTGSPSKHKSSSEETLGGGELAFCLWVVWTQIPDAFRSVVQPEASGTALPTANAVRLLGPVAIEGIESLRAPVPRWIPNLPTHPVPIDLLKESSFAPHS